MWKNWNRKFMVGRNIPKNWWLEDELSFQNGPFSSVFVYILEAFNFSRIPGYLFRWRKTSDQHKNPAMPKTKTGPYDVVMTPWGVTSNSYKYVLDCLGDSRKLDNSAPFFVGTCFLAAKNNKNSSNFNPRIGFKKPIAHHHPTKTYKSWEFCRSTQIILWHDLASEDAILKDPGIQTEATIVPWQPDACWESEGGWWMVRKQMSRNLASRAMGFPYSSPNHEGSTPRGKILKMFPGNILKHEPHLPNDLPRIPRITNL